MLVHLKVVNSHKYKVSVLSMPLLLKTEAFTKTVQIMKPPSFSLAPTVNDTHTIKMDSHNWSAKLVID